jgi:hypothetical protein
VHISILKGDNMPSISEFYGIKIYLYWNDNERHCTPHIHAFYAELQASIDLDGNILGGDLPRTARKLTKKWILENKTVLEYAWMQAKEKRPIPKIKGLM